MQKQLEGSLLQERIFLHCDISTYHQQHMRSGNTLLIAFTLTFFENNQSCDASLLLSKKYIMVVHCNHIMAMPLIFLLVPLLQAYTQKIAKGLRELMHNMDNEGVVEEMRKWICECSSLKKLLAVGNLQNYFAFSSSRLDGSMGPTVSQLMLGTMSCW